MQLAASVMVSPAADTVEVRNTVGLAAVAFDENGHIVTDAEFAWSSSDGSVATVDGSGLVRGVGDGAATITAAAGVAEGSAEVVVLDPERDALEALYLATGGPGWINSDNWMSDAPLGDWHGVETELGSVTHLILPDNRLSGQIPSQLDNLTNLESLYLLSNDLSGPVPTELGNLAKLRELDLSANKLSGRIPTELGDLDNLESLRLNNNDFSGPIPTELGDLAKLSWSDLSDNRLSGTIPTELGDLDNLLGLGLGHNQLSGRIPPELGNLTYLWTLYLADNQLSGPIPNELGTLGNLVALYLHDNELSGPIPPELGNLGRLFVAAFDRNALSGPLPAELANLTMLGALYLDGNDFTGPANAGIPADIIEPGLEMVIEVDPEGTLDEDLLVAKRIPETGRLEVDVRTMSVLDLTVIPFVWSETHDSSIVDLVEAMAEDAEGHEMLRDTRTLLPIGDLEVTAHDPVPSTSNNALVLLGETRAIRLLEGGTGHYKGMMSQPVTGARGVAFRPGRSSFSTPESFILAHELGHNLSLLHAPCGGAGGPDPSYPYLDGSIGAWGFEFPDGDSLVDPPHPI